MSSFGPLLVGSSQGRGCLTAKDAKAGSPFILADCDLNSNKLPQRFILEAKNNLGILRLDNNNNLCLEAGASTEVTLNTCNTDSKSQQFLITHVGNLRTGGGSTANGTGTGPETAPNDAQRVYEIKVQSTSRCLDEEGTENVTFQTCASGGTNGVQVSQAFLVSRLPGASAQEVGSKSSSNIGLILGITLGVIAVIILAIGLFVWRKRQNSQFQRNTGIFDRPNYFGAGSSDKNNHDMGSIKGDMGGGNSIKSSKAASFLTLPTVEPSNINKSSTPRMISPTAPNYNRMIGSVYSQNTSVAKNQHEVIYTYEKRLGDEVNLTLGDVVIVYETYPDDWCRGMNLTTSEEGIFPRVCINPNPME